MQARRAILLNGSRLMRDLIRRVIEKNARFEVVRESDDLHELPAILKETNPDWAFLILLSNQNIPDNQKIELLFKHPSLRIVLLRVDGGQINMEWLVHEHRDLTGMTLDELTHLLQKEWQKSQNEEARGE